VNKEDIFSLIKKNGYIDIKDEDFRYPFFILLCFFKEYRKYKFVERGPGLSLNVLGFYLNSFKKANILKSDYKVRRYFSKFHLENLICYSDNCVPIIESCVRKLDLFKTIIMGITTAENQIQKIEKYKKLSKEYKDRIFDSYIRRRIKDRKKMWLEMEEGVERLFWRQQTYSKNAIILTEEDLLKDGIKLEHDVILKLHGSQLKEWINKNIYWKFLQKPKYIFLGHYHIMFPMIRHNALILFLGHFLSKHKIKLSNYHLSHLGGAGYTIDTDLKEVQNVTIMRY
jgi:hypothetical protein